MSSEKTEILASKNVRIDLDRRERTGSPEIIFGAGKSLEHLREIIAALIARNEPVLVTRLPDEFADHLLDEFRDHSPSFSSGLLRIGCEPKRTGRVALIAAGTSDHIVAEEAAGTLEFYGYAVDRYYDVGVAGIHRLLDVVDQFESADVIIVVAGMEGALPSVVGGLVRQPVIAVPTSVGYGASFQGLSALLGMLNSCASGLTVVNIDNGFGAAAAAHRILRLREDHH